MRRTLLLSVLGLTGFACWSEPQGTRIKAADLQRVEQADAAARANAPDAGRPGAGAPATPGAPGASAAAGNAPGGAPSSNAQTGESRLSPERIKQKVDFEDRTLKLSRRREDQSRALAVLVARRTRTALEQASAEASELMTVQQAERDQRIATEDLEHFLGVERTRRLAENALDLARSQDGLLETREELAQLEMMYSDSSLGDATAEIVLNRTRRRLQRAEESVRLRTERSDELKTITLPREQQKLELELAARTVALENSQRARDAGRLAREAALRDLDVEAAKQQREAEDVGIEAKRLELDLDRFGRDVAADHAAAANAASSAPGKP